MKIKFNDLIVFFLFAFMSFTACQDEIEQSENPNDQETIVSNSTLANLMGRTTANYGAADDILDGSSCFSVDLPVTIVVSDITLVIATAADLEELEDLLDDIEIGEEVLDFIFPITLIFSDYSEIVIENENELQTFIDECVANENDNIQCVDFVYPISFSVFNSEFNIIDTVIIEHDEALYSFLNGLDEDENAVIVSLNFPVTLEYANGEIIEINSNQELAEAIEAAEQYCNDDLECSLTDISTILQECPWDFTDGTDNYNNYQMVFNDNGELLIPEGFATSAIGGNWSLSATDDGLVLTFSELTAFQDGLEGDWIIVECDTDRIELNKGDQTLVLERDCQDENVLFNCFGDFEITTCEQPNNVPVFNLSANSIGLIDCPELFIPSFHETLIDAENDVNPISNTEAYGTLVAQVYLRIEADSGNFEIFTIYLNTISCNYFDCFLSFDAVLDVCYTDATVLYEFNLPLAFDNCEADVVLFYETLLDAESEINPLANPSNYNTAELNSTVYIRAEINDQYQIFPIQLNVVDCNSSSCTEGDINGILTECIWNISIYDGSDNLVGYNFDFEQSSGVVVIYNDTTTIDAIWSTSQTNDGVIINLSNVTGPNIQAINGSWLVVECTAAQLVLHNVNDINNEIVIDRICP